MDKISPLFLFSDFAEATPDRCFSDQSSASLGSKNISIFVLGSSFLNWSAIIRGLAALRNGFWVWRAQATEAGRSEASCFIMRVISLLSEKPTIK